MCRAKLPEQVRMLKSQVSVGQAAQAKAPIAPARPLVSRGSVACHVSQFSSHSTSTPVVSSRSLKQQRVRGDSLKTHVSESVAAPATANVSVEFDNNGDPKYTVIAVCAPNKPGLLSALSGVFRDFGE